MTSVSDVGDVAFALIERRSFLDVDVKSDGFESGRDVGVDQRQSDVSQSNHADFGVVVVSMASRSWFDIRFVSNLACLCIKNWLKNRSRTAPCACLGQKVL